MATDESSARLAEAAGDTACGKGDSLCRRALRSQYDARLKAEPCAIQTSASDDRKISDYVMWLPKYRQSDCEGSGYVMCGNNASRFGPKKVSNESFLQGRGQVTGPRGCFASGIRFLPKEDEEQQPAKKKCHDMSLFARSTQVKKSCGSVSEVDVDQRLRPLPGGYAGAFVPHIMSRGTPVPNITDQFPMPEVERRYQEPVTLGTKKYPSWDEIKEKSDAFRRS